MSRICCATYDLQGIEPGFIRRRDILQWLISTPRYQQSLNPELQDIQKCHVDIYAIGFQGIIPMDKFSKVPKVIFDGGNDMDITRMSIRDKVLYAWAEKLVGAINSHQRYPNYELYGAYMLNGIAMYIIVRTGLTKGRHLSNGLADTIRSGDKPSQMEFFLLPDNEAAGAVGLRFVCGGSSMAFVCCHMHDGDGVHACAKRNAEYMRIRRGMFRKYGLSLYDHDYVFWFGDLNYRLCPPAVGAWTPSGVWNMLKNGELARVLEGDELLAQRRAGVAWQGMEEAIPPSEPSRGRPGGLLPDTQLTPQNIAIHRARSHMRGRRIDYDTYPAWADRVLFRKKPGTPGKEPVVISYAMADIRASDHRPVVCIIDIEVRNPHLACHVQPAPMIMPRRFPQQQQQFIQLQQPQLPQLPQLAAPQPQLVQLPQLTAPQLPQLAQLPQVAAPQPHLVQLPQLTSPQLPHIAQLPQLAAYQPPQVFMNDRPVSPGLMRQLQFQEPQVQQSPITVAPRPVTPPIQVAQLPRSVTPPLVVAPQVTGSAWSLYRDGN